MKQPPLPQDVTLGPLGTAHLAEAHALSVAENWPHRPEDWALLLSLGDGTGAFAQGRLVGTAILIPYGPAAATCNMIIVAQQARGLGLGRRLMQTILDRAGGRECRLVATEAGRPLYEKLGFRAGGEIRQMQGVVGAAPATGTRIDTAEAADLDALVAVDRAAIGMDRGTLVEKLLQQGTVLVLRDDTGLAGYAACRPFGRGHVLGPLVARDDATALVLLQAGLARHAGRFLRIDLTDAGAALHDAAAAAGLAPVGGGIAMTRPAAAAIPAPPAPQQAARVYTLASQALC